MERTITVSVEIEVPRFEDAVAAAPGVLVDALNAMTSVKWEGGGDTLIERAERVWK
jgi:hypothetical protein